MEIKIQNKSVSILHRTTFYLSVVLVFAFTLNGGLLKGQSELNGVLQNYLAVQTTEDYEFIAARNRLRLGFEEPTDFGGLKADIDLIHTFNRSQEIDFLLKEAYFDWYLDKYDLRIGHQKIIWGRSNGAFVTDIVTPVDLREFLTISTEDIRFGITSFNVIRYFGSNSIQLVFAPYVQPDLLPSADSRWFPARQIRSILSPIPFETTRMDEPYSLDDIQVTLRYSLFSPENIDLDLFLMRWTHPTAAYDISLDLNNQPDLFSVALIESYKNSWMAGTSSSLKLSPQVFLLLEALYVHQKYFTSSPIFLDAGPEFILRSPDLFDLLQTVEIDDSFLTTKPWVHTMAGVRTEIFKTTLDIQFFLEGILDYEENILNEETFRYVTVLGTRSFLRDRLQVLALTRYNFDNKDYWIQMQALYEMNDNLQVSLGTNLFGGEKPDDLTADIAFSQYRENSFIFSKIALFF